MSNIRKIIHVDMDAFYASVEQRDNPSYRGLPVVVGGPSNSRGVVAAASYEARKFGIHSAMPSARAAKLCPNLIFITPRFEVYKKVSKQINDIFFEYTDLVEPLSLDEAFLDVTDNKQNIPSATWIAEEIRHLIRHKLGLTASAGVAPNKFVAKIASDFRKPDGLMVIPPDYVYDFLTPLPVRKLFGVGKVTEGRLLQLGFKTVSDLRRLSEVEMMRIFGKSGRFFYRIIRGEDNRRIQTSRIAKSVGAERTFPVDIDSIPTMLLEFEKIAQRVSKRLMKSNKQGKTIVIKVRYHNFETITRSKTLPDHICDYTQIMQNVKLLLEQTEVNKRKVRLLGISISNFKKVENSNKWTQLLLPFNEY